MMSPLSALCIGVGGALAVIIAMQHHTITRLDTELNSAQMALRTNEEASQELQKQIDICNAILKERDTQLIEHTKKMEELNVRLNDLLAADAASRDWWNSALPDAMRRMRDAGTGSSDKSGQTDPTGTSTSARGDTSVPMQNKR